MPTTKGGLRMKDHICIPKDEEIRAKIFREGHDSKYGIHPWCTKTSELEIDEPISSHDDMNWIIAFKEDQAKCRLIMIIKKA